MSKYRVTSFVEGRKSKQTTDSETIARKEYNKKAKAVQAEQDGFARLEAKTDSNSWETIAEIDFREEEEE